MAVIAKTFQDVLCTKCGQHLTDPRNAIMAHDVETGGLKGRHEVCPPKVEPAPPTEIERLRTAALAALHEIEFQLEECSDDERSRVRILLREALGLKEGELTP